MTSRALPLIVDMLQQPTGKALSAEHELEQVQVALKAMRGVERLLPGVRQRAASRTGARDRTAWGLDRPVHHGDHRESYVGFAVAVEISDRQRT